MQFFLFFFSETDTKVRKKRQLSLLDFGLPAIGLNQSKGLKTNGTFLVRAPLTTGLQQSVARGRPVRPRRGRGAVRARERAKQWPRKTMDLFEIRNESPWFSDVVGDGARVVFLGCSIKRRYERC